MCNISYVKLNFMSPPTRPARVAALNFVPWLARQRFRRGKRQARAAELDFLCVLLAPEK